LRAWLKHGSLNELVETFHNCVNFVFVYIAEAHACDEWPINQLEEELPRHQTLADRQVAASKFVTELPLHNAFHIVLDTMDNAFDSAFASWPFRFWGILNRKIALKPQPKDATYDVTELAKWLESHFESAIFNK